MKKVLVMIATLGFLAACSPSVDDYVKDDKLLGETIANCATGAETGEQCEKAKEAMKIKAENIKKNIFG